ncbi:MAG: Crp/Fnr family transcriptional regulator [Altibacter sp.]|nr:Crp/Fnr family transcriptional regulator [Altibacter sp.]
MGVKMKLELFGCSECKNRTQNQIFCNLSQGEIETISKGKSENFYPKGQVIFHEGSRGNGLYCVYKGKVKVYKSGEKGKEQIIRLAKEGEVLGYRSLLSNELYSASAAVIEDSVVCFISKGQFLEVLKQNSELSLETLQLLSRDLRESEKKIVNITQKTVVERIAESLLVLKEKFGLDQDGKTLNATLSRREIGNLAGVSTETTIRTLSELNKTDILNLNGKQIEFLNVNKLLSLANIRD